MPIKLNEELLKKIQKMLGRCFKYQSDIKKFIEGKLTDVVYEEDQ